MMMKKFLFSFLLVQGFVSSSAVSQTILLHTSNQQNFPDVKDGKVKCLQQLDSLVNYYKVKYKNQNVLFVFDIDNTIMVTNENGYGSDKWLKNAMRYLDVRRKCQDTTLHSSVYHLDEILMYDSLQYKVSVHSKKRALECHDSCMRIMPQQNILNNTLKGMDVIALTSRGKSIAMKEITYKSLDSLGYKFVTKKPLFDSPLFARGDFAYSKNIIYTSGGNKGVALYEFLESLQKKYEAVIFFDDDSYKVGDVAAVLTNRLEKIKLHVFQMKMERTLINEYYEMNEKEKLYGNNGFQEAICK